MTHRPNKNVNLYDTIISTTNDGDFTKPPGITAENTIKPGNDTASNEVTNPKINSVTYQNVPIQKSLSTSRLTPGDNISHEFTEKKAEKIVIPIKKYESSQKVEACIFHDQSADQPAQKSTLPKDLSSLSVVGVRTLLASLNMEDCINTFREEQIDGKMLMSLDEATLSSLDLNKFHVIKLTQFIKGWRPNVENNA